MHVLFFAILSDSVEHHALTIGSLVHIVEESGKAWKGAPLTGYGKQTGSSEPGKEGGLRVRWRWGGTGVADWIIDTRGAEMESLRDEMKEEAWSIS